MIDILVIGGIFREVLQGDSKPRSQYGGSGMVASMSAARVGARVALASYVGREDEEAVRHELRLAGVDDGPVISVAGASGTFVFPTVSQDPPWPMYRPAEATPIQTPQELPSTAIVLAFGIPDYDPIAEGWLGAVDGVRTIIWDRQGWMSRARDSGAIAATSIDRKIYLANELEAMEEAERDSIDDALVLLPPHGFDLAVVKAGDKGVTVVKGRGASTKIERIPAFPVKTSSSIGSGDVFAGAFAARLAQYDTPSKAAHWACAAAAVALKSGTNRLGDDAIEAVERLLG